MADGKLIGICRVSSKSLEDANSKARVNKGYILTKIVVQNVSMKYALLEILGCSESKLVDRD